jgi:hypothetical protein
MSELRFYCTVSEYGNDILPLHSWIFSMDIDCTGTGKITPVEENGKKKFPAVLRIQTIFDRNRIRLLKTSGSGSGFGAK